MKLLKNEGEKIGVRFWNDVLRQVLNTPILTHIALKLNSFIKPISVREYSQPETGASDKFHHSESDDGVFDVLAIDTAYHHHQLYIYFAFQIMSNSLETHRRALLQLLSERLIPVATRQNGPPPILMTPDSLLQKRSAVSAIDSSAENIVLHRGTPLSEKTQMRSPLYLQQWTGHGVHAVRFPCLVAVAEGEIDWHIGVTQTMATSVGAPLEECDYLIANVHAGSCFLMPPGTPYSDGSSLHWERATPRKQPATLLWLLILPSGFMCHFCRSTPEQHHSHRQFFVPCPQLYALTKMLEETLRDSQQASQWLARLHLQTILGYAQRALQTSAILYPIGAESMPHRDFWEAHDAPRNTPHDILQRAQMFIETHLQEFLDPPLIAQQIHLSSRQLDRYFQRELHCSVMDYVIGRRLEMAKNLLQVTDLPIRQIAEIVGYKNASSFTQIFKRRVNLSPRQFRRDAADSIKRRNQ